MWRFLQLLNFFLIAPCILELGVISPCGGISINHRHVSYNKTFRKDSEKPKILSKPKCGLKCSSGASSEFTTELPESLLLISEDPKTTTELSMTTILSTNDVGISESPMSAELMEKLGQGALPSIPGKVKFEELTALLRLKRKECRKSSSSDNTYFLKRKNGMNAFTCEKLKLSSWLMDQLEKNTTELFDSYVRLVRNANMSDLTEEVDLMPESGPERLVYRLIKTIGEPVDKLLFYQFKKYTKSRELQLTIPHLVNLQLTPRTHSEVQTGRTLFDPGFNMKLKFPFFHDELKIAVATGPSFIAGLGVGLVVLGIKAIFAPFVLAMKAVILSWFFKDMSPMDLVKTMAAPMMPAWMTGMRAEPEAHYSGWEQSVENYEAPHVQNSYDNQDRKNTGLMGALAHLLPFSSPDQTNQFSIMKPMTRPQKQTRYQSGGGYRTNPYAADEGRTQIMRPNGVESEFGGGDEGSTQESDSFGFIPPTAQQEDVDSFDPFYSPLLSRIDSIFMHLGFSEEGCKERAVCSIYKYPVKYAPYSNLLSAQLSKHQSELKRPVNTSPKVLRYFKYMKAAKDGQAALNCIELYPKCTNDTEKLTNLPMVKTFQQLTELMGTTGPTG